jgi:hypothetical protein
MTFKPSIHIDYWLVTAEEFDVVTFVVHSREKSRLKPSGTG